MSHAVALAWCMPTAPQVPGLAARRYASLIRQLREELGETRWRERVGRKLGVSGAMIGYVERGERGAGVESIEKAQERLGLDHHFFHDPALGDEPDYREHIVRGPEAHWRAFLQRYPRIGSLTAKQRDEIKNFAANNLEIKSWTDYERLAEMVLRDKESATFSGKA